MLRPSADQPDGGDRSAPCAGAAATLPAAEMARILGRPAAAWTVDDLVGLVGDRGVRLVSLMHVGGDGWLKTLDFVPRSEQHLRDILEGGERADGSSLFSGLGIRAGASDILLRPRLETAFLDPFSPLPTLAVLCGHAASNGTPLSQSPDTIVRRAGERVTRELGVELLAHGEVEYFLGRPGGVDDLPATRDRGYHATAPFVFGESLRRQAIATLAAIGVPIKYGHSEVGFVPPVRPGGLLWEQHEVELALAPLAEAADAVLLTHWVLRKLAHREGMRCSFDPILRRGHPGNGLHVHFSPVRSGEHLGALRADGSLSAPGLCLVGGLVQLGGALMAFGNTREDSFVRLRQAKEAPRAIVWGQFDRSALVRLPVVATTAGGRLVTPPTIEFRLPDGSAHPHLLLAGAAQAMVHGQEMTDLAGLVARTEASQPRAAAGDGARIPRGFAEVAKQLRKHRAIFEAGEVFPPVLIDAVVSRLATQGGGTRRGKA